ncbi:phospholipase D-like domain-containing protein [Janthinobacterium sp. 1_2014MBL_MicDiv]|uniref:phospholipase D-like domain-containing protein n=1 Tax=Janthinobacterium sp. 1_2014MBL_MicDiv TaxID=1644131 RepID=UPI000A53D176|nr:phospholipase D-like domain-containing protein [Janthinobacterium sp. 1_2014MBL_MicDiv]
MSGMNSNVGLYEQTLSYRDNDVPRQCLAQPWFVHVPYPIHPPRYRCFIEPLICGEDVFRKIAKDLQRARHSVDIITWGFDPGMVLVRGKSAEDGVRYGDLLKIIASRKTDPVKVRLLIWHDSVATQVIMRNNPGYYGGRFPHIGCGKSGYFSESHQAYNAEWYAQVGSSEVPNIHIHVRSVPISLLEQSLTGEVAPNGFMAQVTKRFATHHQKMLLIDYETPVNATGYVMGHNSVTDFWDTAEHRFRDIRRERIYHMEHVKLQNAAWKEGECYDGASPGYRLNSGQQAAKERLVQSYIDKNSHVVKPYQDVSCRLHGPILYDLNHNFCQAWEKSTRPPSLFMDTAWLLVPPVWFAKQIGNWIHNKMDADFIARRAKIPWSAFKLQNGQHNVQLLRTEPQHAEKSIKECYANLTRQMLRYIFIQNQYIQYTPWAEHLIECVGRLRSAGYMQPIHVFILTSTPEDKGMDYPTYDVASRVGRSEAMKVEHEEAIELAQKKKTKPPITAEELGEHGINVFMGSLWTCAQGEERLRAEDYEEIYIHAKVAVVDDAAFTIGSANLNLRSMALDSELNVLSEAKDVAFQLRCDLFSQCSGMAGPAQFGDMQEMFKQWTKIASNNFFSRTSGTRLKSQLSPFYVDRKPGSPVI